jgi:hypothetical protein
MEELHLERQLFTAPQRVFGALKGLLAASRAI